MKKLLPIGIAPLSVLSASAARAEEAEAGHLVAAWTCGKHVDVELRKYATANYELNDEDRNFGLGSDGRFISHGGWRRRRASLQ
jgi:hypothetical protein